MTHSTTSVTPSRSLNTRVNGISKPRFILAVTIISLLALPWAASAHSLPSAPKISTNAGMIGPCQVFPADNSWNVDISTAPVDPNSGNYINNINTNGSGTFLHPDFGQTPTYGIPYTTVPGTQAQVPIIFNGNGSSESDPGPYPIPSNAPVESGSDRHVLVVDTGHCLLYELDNAQYQGGAQHSWSADWGAVFDLKSNKLRPLGWTSADAAGLPIFAGLARCAEVTNGAINHALRFTVNKTQQAYIYPARHFTTGYTGTNYPPMGLRLRLKSSYNTSALTGQAMIIATALKKYGMMVADNGSNWFISGDTNPSCWNDNDLNELKAIPGTAFEVVQSAPTLIAPTDNIATTTPAFTWDAASGAQGYYLYVTDGISVIISQSVATSACSGGICSFTPASPLPGSNYTWTVAANYGTRGWGSYATSLAFVIPPTLIAPTGAITNYTPTFTWNNFSFAWGYYIYVANNSGTVMFAQWVGSSPACTSTTCSFISPITLTGNSYTWWITAYNGSSGWSPWSNPMSFALPPTLIGPSGSIATATPNFTWKAVVNAWGYYVYAKTGSTVEFSQWVGNSPACTSTTCTFASPLSLPAGSYTWSAAAYSSDWGWTAYATPLAFTDSAGVVVPSATLKPTFQPPVKQTVK